jgi:hypothetical protein
MHKDDTLKKLRQLFDQPKDVAEQQRRIHEGLAGVDADALSAAVAGQTPALTPGKLPEESQFSSVAMTDGGYRVTLKSPTQQMKYCQYSGKVVGQVFADKLGIGFSADPVLIARGVDVALVETGRVLEISAEALQRPAVETRLNQLFSEHMEMAVDGASRAGRRPGE